MIKTRKLNPTVKSEMLQIVQAWRASGGKWPAPLPDLIDFALDNGLYNARARVRRQCARDLSDAMREDYIADSSGRPVRRLHSARFSEKDESGQKVQRSFWGDIDTMERPFMVVAFNQRRRQIVGDCRQLRNDMEYRNDKFSNDEPIRTLFDFRDDIGEGTISEEYMEFTVPKKG